MSDAPRPSGRPTDVRPVIRRAAALDAVRVLGVVAVVVGHVWTAPAVRAATFSWHVPLFFVLTGWLWRPGRGMRQELSRRSLTLLVPYLVLGLAVGGRLAWQLDDQGRPVRHFLYELLLGGRWVGGPLAAYWFVTALFAAAVLRRCLDPLPLPALRAVVAGLLLLGPVAGPGLSATPLSLGSAFTCLPLLVAGEELHRLHRRVPVRRRPALGTALLVTGALAVLAGSRPPDLRIGDVGTPLAALLVAVLLAWGLLLLADPLDRLPARICRPVSRTASVALVVVLGHGTAMLLGRWLPGGPAVTCLAALVVPWSLGLAAARTRVGWVVGAGSPPVRRAAAARR